MYAMDMRQYDPAIARWVVQDPVVHYTMSPYNSFDNNPVFWADPSGEDAQQTSAGWSFTGEDAKSAFLAIINGGGSFDLKGEYSTASSPGAKFLDKDMAAIDFGMQYNGISIINKVELSSQIYKFNSDGKYSYTRPVGYVEFDKEGNRLPSNSTEESHDVEKNTKLVGHIHTHGNDDGDDILRFSGMGTGTGDMFRNRLNSKSYGPEYNAYVTTPNGSLWKYTPFSSGAKVLTSEIRTNLPSDVESSRRNKPYVSPEVTPKVLPTIYSSNPNFKLKTTY